MGVRAILFDADGVIQGPAPDLPARIHETFGVPLDQVEDFLHNVISPAERRALTGKSDIYIEITEEFARRNWAAPTPEALRVFTSIEVYTDVMNLVSALRASGRRCYLASNQVPFRARYMSEFLHYRDRFDGEFYSCDLGFAKPDSAYFRAILEQAGVSPGETLFLDDREENVLSAKNLGLLASLFVAKSHSNRRESLLELFAGYGVIPS